MNNSRGGFSKIGSFGSLNSPKWEKTLLSSQKLRAEIVKIAKSRL